MGAKWIISAPFDEADGSQRESRLTVVFNTQHPTHPKHGCGSEYADSQPSLVSVENTL